MRYHFKSNSYELKEAKPVHPNIKKALAEHKRKQSENKDERILAKLKNAIKTFKNKKK